MARIQRIAPCLWFDDQAEAAANYYVTVFPNSRITQITRYGKAGFEHHRRPAGSVMTVAFELDGCAFTALNGGPLFRFSEAISLQVHCDTQQEIDHYWSKLGDGGDERARMCGWLKDRYGLSWQIVPSMLPPLMAGDPARADRAMAAVLSMQKLDIAAIEKAVAA